MSLKLKYLDVPYGAQEDAQAAGDGQPFTDMSLVPSGAADVSYATLEPCGWPLDGKRTLMPDMPKTGFWSKERAGADGYFAQPPVLVLSFAKGYTATGITFTFSPGTDEWCREIRISWHNGATLLAQVTAYPDAAHWTLENSVENFNGITVELLAVNKPGSFAKVQCLEIGRTIWFGADEIVNSQVTNEIDPTLSVLTVDTMKVTVKDKHGRYFVPQKNQQMELYQNDQLLAVQYITESTRESKQQYTFSCQSAIGLLEDTFLGGMYDAAPLQGVLSEVLAGYDFVLHPFFENETVTGYLPVCTRREALQQIAFTIGAVISTQRSRDIRIDPISTDITSTFTKSSIFQGAKLDTAAKVARIDVKTHRYVPSNDMETLLDGEDISGEDVLIIFDQPHHGYAADGGTITGSGANWVTITATGSVTLTAKKYVHNALTRSKRYSVTAAEQSNIQKVEDVALVHSGNVDNILKRLGEIAQLRQTLTQEVAIKGQFAGQCVWSASPWGNQIRGYITSMDSVFTNFGHTASITILGMEASPNTVVLYSGELYSGDREVLY